MRPLDPLSSIKLKLGAVIVVTVAVTTAAVVVGLQLDLGWALSALIATVIGLAAIQLLARGMTSPLREMAAAAAAMSGGDYSRRVHTASRDEVGRLAEAFNGMAGELAEVDRFRRELIANVSHELRTPLSALQAVLENVADGLQEPDAQTIAVMEGQLERLRRLVDQLLDLSRLEARAVALERSSFPVSHVLNDAVADARHQAPDSLAFAVAVEPEDLAVDADRDRIHQVVLNLITNAVRHAPPGSTIELTASRRGGEIAVEVVDRGEGISVEDATRVFERFYRSDAARSASDGGSGLGLAIARWIVDLHGGTIVISSADPGCRVTFSLPGGVR
ncbi:MAG: ATP-binding protein [Actinomycetota bacterium]